MWERLVAIGHWLCGFAVSGLLLCGCGGKALSAAAAKTEPWHELTSPHFALKTNLDVDEGQKLVGELEAAYAALQAIAFPYEARLETIAQVAVFDGFADLEPLGYVTGSVGLYQFDPSGTSNVPPIVVLAGDSLDKSTDVLHHELVHRFVAFYYPQAAHWLNEGLAEYYSTLEFEPEQVVFGQYLRDITFSNSGRGFVRVNGEVYLVIADGLVPPMEGLRRLTPKQFYALDREDPTSEAATEKRLINYAAAWATVHTLQDVPEGRRRFQRYLDALHAGKLEEAAAWKLAYGDIPPAELERAFRQFLGARETSVVRIPYTRPAPRPAAVRRMSASDVHLLWSQARNRADPKAAKAADEDIDAAMALAADAPEPYLRRALSRLQQRKLAESEQDMRRAFVLGKGSARYAYSLALVLSRQLEQAANDPARRKELDDIMKGLVTNGSTSAELNFVARYLLSRRRVPSSRHFARRALQHDAGCYRCFETLAMVAEASGDARGAVQAQSTALNLMPHGFEDRQLVSDLDRYRARLETKDNGQFAQGSAAETDGAALPSERTEKDFAPSAGRCKRKQELGALTLSSIDAAHLGAAFSGYRAQTPEGATEGERGASVTRYLDEVHACLHPLFAESFLPSLGGLPPGHPLSNRSLHALVELVIDRSGSLERSGIVRSSGVVEFDIAAVTALGRVFPLVAPPADALARNGRLHLHWELHRDPDKACRIEFARVLVP